MSMMKSRPATNRGEIFARLDSLGYAGEDDSKSTLTEAIRRFQEFNGLTTDGIAGPITERLLMFTPRCGCSDAQRAGLCKWPMKDVAYWHNLRFSGMSDSDVNRAFKAGTERWNDVCGINLHPVDNFQDANIYAHAKVIDSRGGTLAWSFLPCGSSRSTRLEQRYDTREQWSYAFLRRVVMHEIGHAIGFDHNRQRSSIMYAYSNPEVNEPNAADIQGAVRRYGEHTGTPQPPQPPEPPKPPTDPPTGGDVVTVTGRVLINGKPFHLVPEPNHEDLI